MLQRSDWSDRIAVVAVALGLMAAFLPWYAYTSGEAHITVNAFRASVLGDVFFLTIAVETMLVLMRHGLIADVISGRISDRSARFLIAGAAALAVILQLALVAAGARAAAAGLVLAVAAVIGLTLAAWLRRPDPEPRRTVREMLGQGLPD